MQWQEIIEFLGGATVFGAVIAYLGKTVIDAFVSGRVESYKRTLERIAMEHSVRFERLHSERAEVIKDFYVQLAHLDEVLASTLAPFQAVADVPLDEKVGLLSKHFNETREYFVPRRVFFDEATCQLVDKVLDLARGYFFDITAYEVNPLHPLYKFDRNLLTERHQFWEKARTSHETDFTPLKRSLEKQFRTLLGIDV